MAELVSKSAFEGALPITHGDVTLSELNHDAITWVAPFKGKEAEVSDALDSQIGAPFPEPGRSSGAVVWTGPRQAMVLGATLDPIPGAALSDQGSAWACCTLEGDGAAEVLARLVPIDLRDEAFAVDHAARTLLGHMNCILIRRAPQRFEIMVFRSMATSCAHELSRAMAMVAARHALA
ncbi:sarcosine oxidase subunit gamma [Gymnodinialimonas ceratoperidinii]|uniref:Sarcosine oxidase subunit gamma n=1 Tax=Gymnodinialimonas ceratoperidinii TaxID=2856823 RepID=A0A8F6YB77_9RHOB|nr:sarcosine oxidase subunit gamma [Gymnodinialimonas ceratoperidinii]QXT40689.1 sarcosine oxidase subunit gamma [Gymnodinialimonas ceratoperidinii]